MAVQGRDWEFCNWRLVLVMHGTGVTLTSASGNIKMAYGCQWESRLLITELQIATHGPTICARMRLSKTPSFSKSRINRSQFRSDDRTGVWAWKSCSRSSLRVGSHSTKGLGHRRSLTIWRTRTCKKNLACYFRIFSLAYATNDCLPRNEHFANQVPMK